MNLKTRMMLQWIGYFSLVLLPVALVLGLFLFNKVLNQMVLAGTWVVAVFGAVMAAHTVGKMRALRDDERTRQWLAAAERRDEAAALAEERDAEKAKLLEELRGRKDARLPRTSAKPGHWRNLENAALQGQVVRLLKMLGRRVQRSGDSAARGFDLVIDGNAVAVCSANPKGEANAAAEKLLAVLRANPTCTAAILVWPKGIPAKTRYLARGTNLILWDADNVARLVQDRRLA